MKSKKQTVTVMTTTMRPALTVVTEANKIFPLVKTQPLRKQTALTEIKVKMVTQLSISV